MASNPLTRRDFLKTASAATLSALAAGFPRTVLATEAKEEKIKATADTVIVLWMGGGMAHTETFDPKRYAPFERGKGKGRAGQQPGFTPAGPLPAGSPAPFERGRGKAGARQPLTGTPAPFEGGERTGRPGAGAPPNLRSSPLPPERVRPPANKLGESPGPSGGTENIPPGRQRAAEREKFGAPPPTGGTGYERRAPEHRPPPTGLNQPGNPPPAGAPPKGGLPGETRDARGTGQGAYAQPGGPPPRGGGQPPAGEGGQKGPQHGQKKPEKGTPPPGQQ